MNRTGTSTFDYENSELRLTALAFPLLLIALKLLTPILIDPVDRSALAHSLLNPIRRSAFIKSRRFILFLLSRIPYIDWGCAGS